MNTTFEITTDNSFLSHFLDSQRVSELSAEMVEKLKTAAQGDDTIGAYAKYGLGRWHYLMMPDTDSFSKALNLFMKASQAGVHDATAAVGIMTKYGNGMDKVDLAFAEKLKSMARSAGSMLADTKFYREHIEDDSVFQELLRRVQSETLDPIYYHFVADGYDVRGDKSKAIEYYERAVEGGNIASYRALAITYYERGNLILCDLTLEKGFAQGCVSCCTYGYDYNYNDALGFVFDRARETMQLPDGAEPTKEMLQKHVHEQLKQRLEYGSDKGFGLAAYLLGVAYHEGQLGFPVDKKMALHYYIRGMALDDESAAEAVANFFENEEDFRKAYEISDAQIAHFRLLSLRYGNKEIYPKVRAAYDNGTLEEKYHEEFEKVWMPKYDDSYPAEDDYEPGQEIGEDDVTDYEIEPALITIDTDGTFEIIRSDAQSYRTLREMGVLIGAERIDAVHYSGPLNDLNSRLPMKQRLVMYVDGDGYAKDLPDNYIATSLYGTGAELLGKVILALEDDKYETYSFTMHSQLIAVEEELTKKFGNMLHFNEN